jgi:UDP-N-acetylglucosamine:LPS N-acetylglucosamine transferase
MVEKMKNNNFKKQKKLIATASAGGHWVQLLRLRPAFNECEIEYISTLPFDINELNAKLHVVTDANLSEKLKAFKMSCQIFWILLKVRPDFIISTGALPGLVTIALGRVIGAKTVWIDSVANSEQLSLSGKAAKHFAHIWLTQWPDLSSADGPQYWGSVL